MPRILYISILLGAVIACSSTSLTQEKPTEPKIVVEAKGPRPNQYAPPGSGGIFIIAHRFGETCKATVDTDSPHFPFDKPTSITDAMGAPVTEIDIASYGQSWKKEDDIRSHVLQVLSEKSSEFAPGILWDEAVAIDLVGTIQFADRKKGAFEESAGHLCFNDHNGGAIFTRVRLEKTQ
jgi:hypothetical protein